MFASEVLDAEELLTDVEACHMPVTQQVERLRRVLDEHWRDSYTLSMAELVELEDAERHAVIDAVVAGEESPFVVVNGTLVCKGTIDVEAVLAVHA